jgi:Domain of unknown function (DUF4755)
MRAFLTLCFAVIGYIAVIWLSVVLGAITKSWIVFFLCLGVGILSIFKLSNAAYLKVGRINMDSWLSSVADCDYRYAWDGSGIAVDTKNKKIHLTSQFKKQSTSKLYSLSDVREWGYEMPGATFRTPGRIVGGGLQGAVQNSREDMGTAVANAISTSKSMENTGLWLTTKDIDFPKWFIKFRCEKVHDKNAEMELTRWMEILQQNINEK